MATQVVLDDETLKKIANFKRKIDADITPLDVLEGILFYFNEKKSKFTTNNEKIHKAFYDFRDDDLFKEFSFLDGGLYPYSELLDNLFSRLSISGRLNCQNPVYQIFEIDKKQKNLIKKTSLKKFKIEQKERLKKISEVIQNKL